MNNGISLVRNGLRANRENVRKSVTSGTYGDVLCAMPSAPAESMVSEKLARSNPPAASVVS